VPVLQGVLSAEAEVAVCLDDLRLLCVHIEGQAPPIGNTATKHTGPPPAGLEPADLPIH
jgi:hypothetical protein